MATVLAIVPGPLVAMPPANLAGLSIDICTDPLRLLRLPGPAYDLLVLAGISVDQQQAVAARFHADRRWRVVPILYVLEARAPGFAVPGGYRPEIDGLARGSLHSPEVHRRMREMAREGTGGTELVIAGALELDPTRGLLHAAGVEVSLTGRECEVLAILLAGAGRTVTAGEIIERAWGAGADERYLQILRRHVSNIRTKLGGTVAASSLLTVRGTGYRLQLPLAA
ncbi:MAG: winged helix-turn-helix transcriptional regulator [Chloroflexi bacterium]|nr:winged helix-turn-helix transcriptional regulator [Chloroflexota bacterium]